MITPLTHLNYVLKVKEQILVLRTMTVMITFTSEEITVGGSRMRSVGVRGPNLVWLSRKPSRGSDIELDISYSD